MMKHSLVRWGLPLLALAALPAALAQTVAIDPATETKTVFASNLVIGLPPSQGGPPGLVPTGVAVGAGGTVYVSSDIRNALYRLTPPAP